MRLRGYGDRVGWLFLSSAIFDISTASKKRNLASSGILVIFVCGRRKSTYSLGNTSKDSAGVVTPMAANGGPVVLDIESFLVTSQVKHSQSVTQVLKLKIRASFSTFMRFSNMDTV